MHQNVVSSTKNSKHFLGRVPRPFPQWEGGIPSPRPSPRRLRHLDPSHSKILGMPLPMPAMLANGMTAE